MNCCICGVSINDKETISICYQLCNACYNAFNSKKDFSEFINKHDYKPVPIFHRNKYERKKNLYCGIELEIQGKYREGVIEDNVSNPFFYYKEDGSLDEENGIEIVSHPATLKYHKDHWKKMFDSLYSNEMDDLDNCGLHFHFNRDFFTNNDIASLDYFINKNVDIVERIGGREINNAYFEIIDKRLSDWGKDVYRDRYVALNLQNKNTIEIRFFASTNCYNVFIERLKTAFALVYFCKKYNTLVEPMFKLRDKFNNFLNCYKNNN